MTTQAEEIPEDIKVTAWRLAYAWAMPDEDALNGCTKAIAAALLAERNRTIEACAGIAEDEDGHFSHWGEDRNTKVAQQTCKAAADAIRAQLK